MKNARLIKFTMFLTAVICIAIFYNVGYHLGEPGKFIMPAVAEEKAATHNQGNAHAAKDTATKSYQKLYPDFYAPKKPNPVEVKDNTAYLTFDDGPSPVTRKILATLEQEGVKATFFVVGADSRERALMKEIVAQGHAIGMHSYSHNYRKIYHSVADYLKDMYSIFNIIKQTTGVTPTICRFPGGTVNAYNGKIYKEILAEMHRRGFVAYDWNICSQDAGRKLTQGEILNNVVHQIGMGGKSRKRPIILMHDARGKQTTAAALPAIIHFLKKQGYEFDIITSDTKPVLLRPIRRSEPKNANAKTAAKTTPQANSKTNTQIKTKAKIKTK